MILKLAELGKGRERSNRKRKTSLFQEEGQIGSVILNLFCLFMTNTILRSSCQTCSLNSEQFNYRYSWCHYNENEVLNRWEILGYTLKVPRHFSSNLFCYFPIKPSHVPCHKPTTLCDIALIVPGTYFTGNKKRQAQEMKFLSLLISHLKPPLNFS